MGRLSYQQISALDDGEIRGSCLKNAESASALITSVLARLVTAAVTGMTEPSYLAATRESYNTVAVDLSPKMVEVARQRYSGLRFEVGSMTALDLKDGELGGVVAWYSTHHIPAGVAKARNKPCTPSPFRDRRKESPSI
ncbi:class I SAM-dependent methyltransferase [Nonomuraea guangzhouensis]|uniref:Class I SAM-dependent methyltransferase n=1 Tax=Nonomuraea guangzhouensis TaxID=1291555 RepID=A0ABW4G7S9_9ACTN|nr:class I SAM-dependent methyltransferase [Nonomuraea guangzhouensis]